MKRILHMAALALVIVLGSSFSNTASAQYDQQYDQQNDQSYDQNRDVDYQTFYDELSPHGRWVDYPGQGYVWVPDAGPDFRPYSTNGHWVWTDNYEWMWVSDYDWGWAPFHYGRWDNDPSYGWYWVPGYEWSPAWVAWRDGGDYYGWAPIRPGINISINFNIGGYSPPIDFWCFTPRRYITSPRIYDYYMDRRQNITIINYTTIISNNYRYNSRYGFGSGPRRYDAERYCGAINPVRFRQSYSPGRSQFRNNEVSVYRPNVRRDNNRTFAPRNVERYDRNYTAGTRRNDNRTAANTPGRDGNNNGRFDRRDNGTGNQPGNNGDGRINRPVDRTTNTPGNNNGNGRFERRDNNNGTPGNSGDGRVNRPVDRTNTSGTNNDNSTRRFERRDNGAGNQPGNNGDGRVNRPVDRTNTPGNNNDNNTRRFERRDNNNGPTNTPPVVRQPEPRRTETNFPQRQQQPQMERRQQETRPQPQQRQETRQQPQQRQETRQQQPQQQPRQFEHRESNGGGGGNSAGGNNNGRRRF